MITVHVNGKPVEFANPVTVQVLLNEQGNHSRFVAVARNGEVVRRSQLATELLADGDKLEILRPVSGG